MKLFKFACACLLFLLGGGCAVSSGDDDPNLPPTKTPPSVPVSCPYSQGAFTCPSALTCEFITDARHVRCRCVGSVQDCGVVS